MELFKVFGRIALDGQAEINRGLEQANSRAEEVGRSLQNVGGRISSAGGTMTKFVTGPLVGAGAGLLALAKRTANIGDEIAKGAKQANIDSRVYQAIGSAFQKIGIEQERAQRGIIRLNQSLGEAASGSQNTIEAFEKLGFSEKELREGSVETEEAFRRTIRMIEGAETQAEATAVASELLGRRLGPEMVPLIRSNEESVEDMMQAYIDLGRGMSGEQLQAAEDFQDAWQDLREEFADVVHEVGASLLPILIDDLIPAIREHIIPGLVTFSKWIAELIQQFANGEGKVKLMGAAFVGIAAALGPALLVLGQIIIAVGKFLPLIVRVVSVGARFIPVIGWVVTAILGVIAVFKNWDSIVRAFRSVWDFVVRAVSKGVEMFAKAFQWLWDKMRAVWGGIVDVVSRSIERVVGVFTRLRDGVVGIWESIRDRVQSIVMAMVNRVRDMIQALHDATIGRLKALWNALVGNSIIVDLADDVIGEMSRMADGGIMEADRFADGVEMSANGMNVEGVAGRQSGSGGMKLDLRHSVFRDDRDLEDRMRRSGLVMAGAW